MGKKWDKLSRNLIEPQSEADIKRKAEYGNSFQGRVSNLPDMGSYAKVAREATEWHMEWLREAFRVLKPGGMAKVFSATRTFHWLAYAMEQVGFQGLRIEAWVYGSGFPKSLNVSKAIDRHLGKLDEREVVDHVGSENPQVVDRVALDYGGATGKAKNGLKDGFDVTAPATEEAKRFSGYGTALKPAWEPFLVGVKP